MRRFDLYMTLAIRMQMYVIPPLLLFGGLVLVYATILHASKNGPWFILPFWLAGVAWVWWQMLRMPCFIQIHEDGRIEFVARARRLSVWPRQIQSIRPCSGKPGILEVKWDGGRVKLFNQFDDFHEFLGILKSVHPSVELRGC